MPDFGKCPFYREAETATVGKGLGYCDFGGNQTICDGDVQFCEHPDDLKKQLEANKEDAPDHGQGGDKKAPCSYTVLVVDDQEPMGKLVAVLLSRLGHRCILATNGAEALNKVIHNAVDAVITDIVMPEMDGIVLTKQLLSLSPKLPIMVMTAYSKEYPTESALLAGARDFIKKPFSVDEFVLRFNKMMRDQAVLAQMKLNRNDLLLRSKRTSL